MIRFVLAIALLLVLLSGLAACAARQAPTSSPTPAAAITLEPSTPAPASTPPIAPSLISTPTPSPAPAFSTPAPDPATTPSLSPGPTPAPEPLWKEVGPPPGISVPSAQWIEVSAPDEKKIWAAVFQPQGAGPFPVIVVLHGTEGFRLLHTQLAEDLSRGGFITVAGCWFGDPPQRLPGAIDCANAPKMPIPGVGMGFWGAVDNVMALVNAARSLPQANPERVGLFGHSRGSMAATAVALTGADLQAVVAVAGYASMTANPRATIDKVQPPILILHGMADGLIPVQEARGFEAALRAQGKTVEAYYYEGAPHRIPYDSLWRTDVRQRSIAFFTKNLMN